MLTPSLAQNKAEIESSVGSRYKAHERGIPHIKLEVSDEGGRRVCELQSASLESADHHFDAWDIGALDPDPILPAILSFYLYELMGYNALR